jgi:hypothetical protein
MGIIILMILLHQKRLNKGFNSRGEVSVNDIGLSALKLCTTYLFKGFDYGKVTNKNWGTSRAGRECFQ